jgi:hypothetical protein
MALIFQTHKTNIVVYRRRWDENNLRFLNVIHPNFYLLLIQICQASDRERATINESLQILLIIKCESF